MRMKTIGECCPDCGQPMDCVSAGMWECANKECESSAWFDEGTSVFPILEVMACRLRRSQNHFKHHLIDIPASSRLMVENSSLDFLKRGVGLDSSITGSVDWSLWDIMECDYAVYYEEYVFLIRFIGGNKHKEVVCTYPYHNKDIQYLGKCDKCNSNVKIV